MQCVCRHFTQKYMPDIVTLKTSVQPYAVLKDACDCNIRGLHENTSLAASQLFSHVCNAIYRISLLKKRCKINKKCTINLGALTITTQMGTNIYEVFFDHNIVCFNSTLFKPPSTIIHCCRSSFRLLNYKSFENDLNRAFDDLLSQHLEVDEFASALNTALNNIVNKHAPIKHYSFCESSHPRCFLFQKAIAAKKNCRRMERHYKHEKSALNFVNYKNAKRVARDAIMRSRIDSIKNTLNNCSNFRDF
ncbi:hypothetical protein HELRODRAFT_158642 [Helobdella robusta]|uniref:Uncharacterized protein n=1 Tax=Helobdella robusta TaxID=6412 RepID=T1EN25_HELRO|nr:hypothetical protein HELRODRAFT_158642 [Helobdella robusta]ESO12178.1 hypothetical protein HELRODRAFT_158642 [Helobdella robusta]